MFLKVHGVLRSINERVGSLEDDLNFLLTESKFLWHVKMAYSPICV